MPFKSINLIHLASILNEILPSQKLAAIKAYRALAECSLWEAKTTIDSAPGSTFEIQKAIRRPQAELEADLTPNPFAKFVILDADNPTHEPLIVEDHITDAEIILRAKARKSPGKTLTLYRAITEASCPTPEVNMRRLT